MGMSTHVIGIKPPDKKWKAMKKVLDTCKEAGVEAPDEVWEFFEQAYPDPSGVMVELKGCTAKYRGDCQEGIEIDLKKLPKGVTVIRFYNSY